jgi:hypothetical protein
MLRRDLLVLFAGSPVLKPAPDGMSQILDAGNQGSLGSTGGITLIPNAAAFVAPSFQTSNVPKRVGGAWQHFAQVQRTQANDVTHQSFYPGDGDHIRKGMTYSEGGVTYQYYWRVSKDISELIRRGEQEHLDDAKRAFDLSYGLIGKTINDMAAGPPFGPASTPAAATQMAKDALARALPQALGAEPSSWVRALDRMLLMTQTRDQKQWHAMTTGPDVRQGNRIILPVMADSSTQIGRIPSSQVVNY